MDQKPTGGAPAFFSLVNARTLYIRPIISGLINLSQPFKIFIRVSVVLACFKRASNRARIPRDCRNWDCVTGPWDTTSSNGHGKLNLRCIHMTVIRLQTCVSLHRLFESREIDISTQICATRVTHWMHYLMFTDSLATNRSVQSALYSC